jgi:hypothetical protein
MNGKVCTKPAQRPDGFTDRSSGLAGKHAHEQGWRIIEVGKATTAKTKKSASGARPFAFAMRGIVGPAAGSNLTAAYSQVEKSKPLSEKNAPSGRSVLLARSALRRNAA